MAYRKNVTDKQQGDVESAVSDSAARFAWFDGKQEQVGQMKSVRAYEVPSTEDVPAQATPLKRQFSGSGLCVAPYDDKPSVFENPGKA